MNYVDKISNRNGFFTKTYPPSDKVQVTSGISEKNVLVKYKLQCINGQIFHNSLSGQANIY